MHPTFVAVPLLVTLGCASTSPPDAPKPPPDVRAEAPDARNPAIRALAELIVAALQSGVGTELANQFDADMKTMLPPERLAAFLRSVVEGRGPIVSRRLVSEEAQSAVYWLDAARGRWQLDVAATPDGRLAGMKISEPAVARSPIAMELPVRGAWTVLAAGATPDVNHHLAHASQRRAADLLVVGGDGKTFRGDGRHNSDYLAYGKEVFAAAEGEVVTVVDGIADNTPGLMNAYFAPGNMIILEHAPGVFSVYAHLVPGSARVRVGDHVGRGQALGACGNSGNSSESHLHFQVQDGSEFERSFGMEAALSGVQLMRDGATSRVDDYVFMKGDRVSTLERTSQNP